MTDFWRDKRVLVTGGTGFVGRYVVQQLHDSGAAEVFAPGKVEYDLREKDAILALLQTTRPHIVIHLAASVGGIGINQEIPAEFFYDNLMMGAQLLHESWRSGVDKFVGIGTVCEYPKYTPVPFKEENLWDGYPEETNAPYGMAKKMLLVQGQAYRRQYGFNVIHLMPVNLYGPGDDFEPRTSHVIPALIRKCIEAKDRGDETIVVWGDGSPTREFLYVEDAAEGILLASERYDRGEPVNLGSGKEISIHGLAQTISRLVGFGGRIEYDTSKPNGQPRRALDTSRARELFGFEAHTSFEAGLARTVAWYEQQLAIQKMQVKLAHS